jgi:hypothetical protein
VGGGSAATLTDAALNSAVAEAISFWQSAGAETSAIGAIQVRTADLVGSMLGHHFDNTNTIVIDSNAAGRGWSFGSAGLTGSVDLFSTVAHELGHALGFDHLDPIGVMQATFSPGAGSAATTGISSRDSFSFASPASGLIDTQTRVDDDSTGSLLDPAALVAFEDSDERFVFGEQETEPEWTPFAFSDDESVSPDRLFAEEPDLLFALAEGSAAAW